MNLTELIFTAAFLFGVGLFTGKFFKKLNPFLMPIGLVFGGAVLVVIMRRPGVPLFDRTPMVRAHEPLAEIDDDKTRR